MLYTPICHRTFFFHDKGTDFVPLNSQELIEIYSSIYSEVDCTFLCNRDPRCRTLVFDTNVSTV